MSMSDDSINEYELHAFVDDQLPPERRQLVEAHLARDAGDAARVQAWREQKRMLHALFDPVLGEDIPEPLTRIRPSSRRGLPPWLAHAAMALLYVSLGLLAGRFLGPASTPAPGIAAVPAQLGQQAALAHAVYSPEVLHPVEVRAEQQAHLVKWLSKRLGHELSVPDLSAEGMQLIGGRLLPGDSGPAAQFMYEDQAGRRLTLFIRSDLEQSHDSAFQFSRRDDVSVFYWIDGNLGYALSGEMEREPLLAIATRIYAQINQ